MFKCKECGTEYDIKPDFCDCGNNTFEEVAAPVQKAPVEEEPHTYKEPADFHKTQKNTDVVSSIIFLFCVTLAIIILFFVGNPKEDNTGSATQKTTETQKQAVNLPSIDSLWNNSTAGIINNEKSKRQQVAQTAQMPASQPQVVQPTMVAQPQVKQQENNGKTQNSIAQKIKQNITNTQPKQTAQSTTKTTQTAKTAQTAQTVNTPKPNIPKTTQAIANGQNVSSSQTQTAKPVQQVQKQTNTTANTTQKTVSSQTTVPKTTTQPTQSSTVVNVPTQTELRPKTTVDTQALKKEIDNYKIGLRNTIGKKIDFANVIGDGDCTISFKVASNGKLTNRTFSKQSSNITLNDAVYSAVMSTPSYNPPPTGYNNETMNLHIKFYNGNFDISLN